MIQVPKTRYVHINNLKIIILEIHFFSGGEMLTKESLAELEVTLIFSSNSLNRKNNNIKLT